MDMTLRVKRRDTGFDPRRASINPAAEIARARRSTVDAFTVVGCDPSGQSARAKRALEAFVTEIKPRVISLGLAPGEPMIRLERSA